MRVLLADDQEKVCSALSLLLREEANIEVVGVVARAEDLFAQIAEIRPDMVLLDWELPRLVGSGQFATLSSFYPDLKVIALSARPEARRAALAAGVDDFVTKTDPPERLLKVVRSVAQGMANGRKQDV